MYTLCPECHTRYRISSDQLEQADGQVVCGQCHTQFDARASVSDHLQEVVTIEANSEPYIDEGPQDQEDGVLSMPAQVDLEGVTETVQSLSEAGDDIPMALADDLVRQQQDKPAPDWSYLGQWAVVTVLFVVMLVQGVFLYRVELSRDPLYAPHVRTFCDWLGCELPLPRFPRRIAVLERDVRLHPRVDNALVVNATLVNQAEVAQAYPMIELRMSDIAGTQIAGRWFRPQDYLKHAITAVDGMLPGKEVHLLLEVVDPGEDVVSFQLNFR